MALERLVPIATVLDLLRDAFDSSRRGDSRVSVLERLGADAATAAIAHSASRPAIELSSGPRIRMPLPWQQSELVLPGNFLASADAKQLALYDETTGTGLMYDARLEPQHLGTWTMIQPVKRSDFACIAENFFNS